MVISIISKHISTIFGVARFSICRCCQDSPNVTKITFCSIMPTIFHIFLRNFQRLFLMLLPTKSVEHIFEKKIQIYFFQTWMFFFSKMCSTDFVGNNKRNKRWKFREKILKIVGVIKQNVVLVTFGGSGNTDKSKTWQPRKLLKYN